MGRFRTAFSCSTVSSRARWASEIQIASCLTCHGKSAAKATFGRCQEPKPQSLESPAVNLRPPPSLGLQPGLWLYALGVRGLLGRRFHPEGHIPTIRDCRPNIQIVLSSGKLSLQTKRADKRANMNSTSHARADELLKTPRLGASRIK